MTDRPTDAATLDRAVRLANESMRAVALQCRRATRSDASDADFPMRPWTDFLFLVIALWRLRMAAHIVCTSFTPSVQPALADFDKCIPYLRNFRNVALHVDEYAVDAGRTAPITRRDLEVGSWDERSFTWLGHTLCVDEALAAAEQLYRTLLREAGVRRPHNRPGA